IPIDNTKHAEHKTEFVGYRTDNFKGIVWAYGSNAIIVDWTPFYAESGGQVGDTGEIVGEDFRFIVEDTKKNGNLIVQFGQSLGEYDSKSIFGKEVNLAVDALRRRNIEKNHSATHLFHEALRKTIGEHSHQQGSLVAPDHLRFDFNHFEKISPDQLKK